MDAARLVASALRATALFAGGAAALSASAQSDALLHDLPPQIVLPQRHVIPILPMPEQERVRVTGVEVEVAIVDGIATTTLDVRLENPGTRRAEAVVLLPVPDQAVVRAFTFEGPGAESTARLLPRDEARRLYDAIVARTRDPALLEFAGLNVVRSSVFPVEPHGKQTVRLTYEQVLPADGDRRDFALPRSEALDNEVPWRVRVQLRDRRALGAIYSPSHEIELRRDGASRADISLARGAEKTPGSFFLSYLATREAAPAASVFLYPDPKIHGGYFLLLAGAAAPGATPARAHAAGTPLRRELTLVLDHSGSMRGAKLEQAKEAARQIVAGLEPGERFHLVAYHEIVEAAGDEPEVVSTGSRRRATEFIDALTARGGTNLHDALLEALRPAPVPGFVPVVLFLTDGVPTVGPTSEKAIRELASQGNPHQRRVFTFGVGTEVNTALLQSVALATRGAATFVLPGEDIEVKVSAVFRRLAGPALAGPRLRAEEDGRAAPGRTLDVLPAPLPDLFAGDELLVFGRYRGEAPFDLVLAATAAGGAKSFELRARVDPAAATTRHAFVPRLWAARRIGGLVAALRDLGADGRDPQELLRDPATRELVDEIVKLSTEFGILTEYTSFLAEEGSELPAPAAARERAQSDIALRALPMRSGAGAVSQDANVAGYLQRKSLNRFNALLDARLVLREVRSIQQISDLAFYRRDGRWIDGRLAARGVTHPQRTIESGSAEHRRLVDELVSANRQAAAALPGDVLLEFEGEAVLLRNSAR